MKWRVAMVIVAAGACLAMSQPPQDKPERDGPAREGERPERMERQPEDRESYKARLERSLADNKRRQERLEAALKKLSEGASVEEVRREAEGPRPPQMRERGRGPGAGRPGEDRRPDGPPPERMSREEVVGWIEANDPEAGARFRKVMEENPSIGGRIIDRMEPMIREIQAERDEEMRKLRIANLKSGFDLVGASRAYGEARRADPEGAAAKEAGEKLRQLLGAHFDLQTKIHQREIVLLEKRIELLREDLSRQVEERERYIERRMEDVRRFRRERDGKAEGKAGEERR